MLLTLAKKEPLFFIFHEIAGFLEMDVCALKNKITRVKRLENLEILPLNAMRDRGNNWL